MEGEQEQDSEKSAGAGDASNSENKLSKEDIVKLLGIKSNRIQLKFGDRKNKQSYVWEKFKEVIVDDVVTDFMKCSNCHRILKCKAANGITTMKRHWGVCCSASSEKNKGKTEGYLRNRNERLSRIVGIGQTKMTSFAHKVVPAAEIANLN